MRGFGWGSGFEIGGVCLGLSHILSCACHLRFRVEISSKFDALSLDLNLGVWPPRPEFGMSGLGTNTLGMSLGV